MAVSDPLEQAIQTAAEALREARGPNSSRYYCSLDARAVVKALGLTVETSCVLEGELLLDIHYARLVGPWRES